MTASTENKQNLTVHTALRRLRISRGAVLFALLLLCNPLFHLTDVFPDFIAWLILMASLRNLAEINDSLADAYRLFRRMAFLSAGRFAALLLSTAFLNESERPVGVLLCTFVFGLLELITLFPAVGSLFHGFTYLDACSENTVFSESAAQAKRQRLEARQAALEADGTRHEAACRRLKRKRERTSRNANRSLADAVKIRCFVFAVIKTALCVLPELSSLSISAHAYDEKNVNWYVYVNEFRAIAVTLGLVFGVIWLCRAVKFWKRVTREETAPFWAELGDRYDTFVTEHPARVHEKAIGRFGGWMIAALVFFVDVTFDQINVLPSFMIGILLLIALRSLRQYLSPRLSRFCVFAFLSQSVVALGEYAISFWFFGLKEYDIFVIFRSMQMQADYAIVLAAVLAEAVLNLLGLLALFLLFRAMIEQYTGALPAWEEDGERQSKALSGLHRSLKKAMIAPAAVVTLSIICHVVYAFLMPTYPVLWVPDLLLAATAAVLVVRYWHDLRENLNVGKMMTIEQNN